MKFMERKNILSKAHILAQRSKAHILAQRISCNIRYRASHHHVPLIDTPIYEATVAVTNPLTCFPCYCFELDKSICFLLTSLESQSVHKKLISKELTPETVHKYVKSREFWAQVKIVLGFKPKQIVMTSLLLQADCHFTSCDL